MEFTYHYERQEPQQLKYFLKEQGISKGLLAKIKFQGGKIFVNDQRQNVLYSLVQNDTVTIVIPDEGEHETVLLDETPIEIVYEDQHLLIVNKPAGIASIPAQYHPNGTMANRVKAYYKQQGYQDQVIHVVTRLDRDTSGLMLFAKHGFAHAKLDVQLRQKQLIKKYQAIVAGQIQELASHGEITYPIARDLSSLLKRKTSLEGKSARTEYWLTKRISKLLWLRFFFIPVVPIRFAFILLPSIVHYWEMNFMAVRWILALIVRPFIVANWLLPILSAENRCILKQTCRQIWHQSNKQ